MKMKFIITIFLAATIFSCSKKDGKDEFITLSYQQTYCNDPWSGAVIDSLALINLQKYFAEKDLYIASLSIKQTSDPEICNACSCKTGKTIYVSTLNSENIKQKLYELGFK